VSLVPSEVIEVRPYRPSVDKDFLYSTWLKNYKHSSYFAKRIKPTVFFRGHQIVVDHILNKPTCKALVACPKDDSETILGYIVFEPTFNVVHFTFVKDAFRNMGIARRLLKESGIDTEKLMFSHWTFPIDEIIRKYEQITYNPYLL
jgi:hypothetical protein